MGMDLTLCPEKYGARLWHGSHLAYTRIDLGRNYELFGQIDSKMGRDETIKQVCTPQRLPPNVEFMWYGDEGIKATRTDPYGDLLTYVEAGELAKVDVPKGDPWNQAVFAMMKALPENTPVVLWWH